MGLDKPENTGGTESGKDHTANDEKAAYYRNVDDKGEHGKCQT